MPEDKDFKRLVRQRMARTGESYTTARARLRPPETPSLATLATRTGLDGLAGHLETAHGIEVRKTTQLDVGVYRVDRHDGPSWVARVFPAARARGHVEDDARILGFLEERDLPVERLAADNAISTLDGQGVLVTRHQPGTNARHDTSGPTLLALGSILGRVHALHLDRCAVTRPAGGWHHIVPNGGGVGDAARTVLSELDDAGRSEEMRFLRSQLESVSSFDDLPQAVTHPDPCGANAVLAGDGTPVLIDWTGAGRGPRVLALAALLAGSLHPVPGAPRSRNLEPVDAVMVGYRAHVSLTDEELHGLAAAIVAGWVVLASWMHVVQGAPLRELARSVADHHALADRVSARVRETFDLDDETLTPWARGSRSAVDPAQMTLF